MTKTNLFKSLWLWTLFLVMGTASAQNVAKIGSTEYETLAAAVNAATEGQTITMLSNVDITTGGVTIAEGKNITLDLNGHDIKAGEQNTNNITVNGKLTLEDNSTEHNGKIYTEEPYSRGVAETGVVRVVGGEFVMNSGNIYAVIESNPENYGQFGVVMWEGAKVTINGGQIKAGWYTVANNGTDQSTMAITINGGELISTTDYAIYQPAKNSSLNVTDGVVYGAAGAIAANGGTVNVTGGTITSKGQGSTGTWGDGTGGLQNAAINVNAKYGNTTCAISGGTITAEGDAVTLTTNQTYTGTIAVTGGTFSSAIPAEFCAPGFVPEVNEDGTYGVKPDGYVAQIGETKYETLAEAVADVPADGTETTITMIADETIPGNAGVTIPAGKNIVLDLNGKTVKNAVNENKASQVILNKGILSIKDSSAEGTGLLTNDIEEGSATGDWWSTPQYNYATNVITNNGTLTITSGNIHETATSSICYAIDNNSSAADAILNLEGGLITTLAPTTIRMFCNSTTKENTLNMSEASTAVVESSGTSALYIQLPGSSAQKKKGTLNIAGGTLTGGTYAFYDYSYGDLYDEVKYNLSGGTYNGSYSFFSYGANIDITGGTYNGAVYIKQMKASEVSVSDGLFAGDIRTYGDNATTKFISGGKFANYTFVSQGTTYGCYWLYRIADGYDAYDNTDPATKDAYPYMVAPIKVLLEVDNEVVVTTNPEATAEEQEAANAAVEELGSNVNVTDDDATNVTELEDVHTLVITIKSASVETEKVDEDVSATITQVTYDVQPYKNDEKVNVTTQPLTFRLPVPQSFKGTSVKVSHKHNEITTTYETVQGEGANKFVALSSDKFSEWTIEDITYGTVAVIEQTGAQFTTLAEAFAAVQTGQTIIMVADAKAGAMVEISGKNITLDLNGKEISPVEGTKISGGLIGIHNGAGLTIDDSSADKNGIITSGSDGKVYAAVQVTVKGDAATSPATLVVNNGNLTGYYYGIAGNGNRHNTVVTINGGTITGQEGTAIYHPQDGTLNINDGTLTGKETAVELRAGTINVTGGELTASATEFAEQGNGSGTTIVGAALAVSQHATNKDIAVNISGGTFNGINAVYEKDYQDTNCDNIAMNITDGTFNGSVASQNVEKFVSGGSFQEIIPAEYCALGFVPVTTPDAHGMYTVEESDTELTVYVGDSTPHTMSILEFLDTQETQPNAMAIVASAHAAEVEGLTNVIIDYPAGHGHYYECENFVLDDWYDWYSPVEEFVAVDGSYSRGIDAGLTTICVPFDVVENSTFNKYIFHSADVGGNTAYFNSVAKVNAGEAFLAQVDASTTWNPGFDNTRIYANTKEGGAIRGTYRSTNVGTVYKVNDAGTGLQLYSGVVNYPFRAYFDLSNESIFSQTRSFRIAFDEIEEGTTGISGVGNDANNNVIYNAQGLRMNKIQNGLNIVNGKKILK